MYNKKNLKKMDKTKSRILAAMLASEITAGYKVVKESMIPQILNYYDDDGEIKLYQLCFGKSEAGKDEQVVIVMHASSNCVHVLMLTGSIEEVEENHKVVKPVCIFTFHRTNRDKTNMIAITNGLVNFADLSLREFELFCKIQRVLYGMSRVVLSAKEEQENAKKKADAKKELVSQVES